MLPPTHRSHCVANSATMMTAAARMTRRINSSRDTRHRPIAAVWSIAPAGAVDVPEVASGAAEGTSAVMVIASPLPLAGNFIAEGRPGHQLETADYVPRACCSLLAEGHRDQLAAVDGTLLYPVLERD